MVKASIVSILREEIKCFSILRIHFAISVLDVLDIISLIQVTIINECMGHRIRYACICTRVSVRCVSYKFFLVDYALCISYDLFAHLLLYLVVFTILRRGLSRYSFQK